MISFPNWDENLKPISFRKRSNIKNRGKEKEIMATVKMIFKCNICSDKKETTVGINITGKEALERSGKWVIIKTGEKQYILCPKCTKQRNEMLIRHEKEISDFYKGEKEKENEKS